MNRARFTALAVASIATVLLVPAAAQASTTAADQDAALITEVTFPKLSGDSKEAAYFDVEFYVEGMKFDME